MSEVTKEQTKKALEFVGIHTDDEDYIRYPIIGQSDHFMNIPIEDFKPHLSLDDMAVLENALSEEDKLSYMLILSDLITLKYYEDIEDKFKILTTPANLRFQAFTKIMEENE